MNRAECVKLLLYHGADPQAICEGQTAMDIARTSGSKETMVFLKAAMSGDAGRLATVRVTDGQAISPQPETEPAAGREKPPRPPPASSTKRLPAGKCQDPIYQEVEDVLPKPKPPPPTSTGLLAALPVPGDRRPLPHSPMPAVRGDPNSLRPRCLSAPSGPAPQPKRPAPPPPTPISAPVLEVPPSQTLYDSSIVTSNDNVHNPVNVEGLYSKPWKHRPFNPKVAETAPISSTQSRVLPGPPCIPPPTKPPSMPQPTTAPPISNSLLLPPFSAPVFDSLPPQKPPPSSKPPLGSSLSAPGVVPDPDHREASGTAPKPRPKPTPRVRPDVHASEKPT